MAALPFTKSLSLVFHAVSGMPLPAGAQQGQPWAPEQAGRGREGSAMPPSRPPSSATPHPYRQAKALHLGRTHWKCPRAWQGALRGVPKLSLHRLAAGGSLRRLPGVGEGLLGSLASAVFSASRSTTTTSPLRGSPSRAGLSFITSLTCKYGRGAKGWN